MPFRTEFAEISILIPGYSIEDLPTDLAENEAASLWNAISSAWHPSLLAQSASLPMLRQAESQYGYPGRRAILVPAPAESWLPHEWRNVFREQDHIVLDNCTQRSEWLDAIHAAVPAPVLIAPDGTAIEPHNQPLCVPDFLAFGTVHLQLQLLSRRRHHYVDPDQILLAQELRAAAEAALLHDENALRKHLAVCFEHLREIREQVYPQKCVLLDLCLPGEQDPPETLAAALNSPTPLNLLITGRELQKLAAAGPAIAELLHATANSGQLCLLSGHDAETRTNLGSMASLCNDIRRCQNTFLELTGSTPKHYARRRFGLTASLPAVLNLFGFQSALHVALDDGLYPDRERSQFDWQSPDGSLIAAASRIPLAIDSAAGFQKFADRLNESMQEDTVAALFLARLPQLRNPWLDDLRIAATWAPVLGEFTTFDELCHAADGSRLTEAHDHAEYLSPALIQASVLKTEPPVSGPAELRSLQQALEDLNNIASIASLIRANTELCQPVTALQNLEKQIADLELQHLDLNSSLPEKLPALRDSALKIRQTATHLARELAKSIASRIPSQSSTHNSLLLINPLPFARLHPLDWPVNWNPPATNPAIEAAELNTPQPKLLTKLPPGGFLWLHESTPRDTPHAPTTPTRREPPLAEPRLLRNKHFEVQLSIRTGGIQSVTFHGQRGNRVSQQTNFRYERELNIPPSPGEEPRKTHFANSKLISHQVLSNGPVFATIETITEFHSPSDGSTLGLARQITQIDRLRPVLEFEIELTNLAQSVRGNPWLTGWCCRFAWDNESATISRSILGQTGSFRLERIESPDYVEIADGPKRLTILADGRPWHRRSGNRMLDSLLVVENEDSRRFRFRLDFDQPCPLRSAEEMLSQVVEYQCPHTKPETPAAWILGLSARHVQLVQSRWYALAPNEPDQLHLILSETDGLAAECLIRTARKPATAHTVNHDASQKVLLSSSTNGEPILNLLPFQIQHVILTF
ncbi:MAG: hypothetical protein RL215_2624 [Planctomycetota bacterium]